MSKFKVGDIVLRAGVGNSRWKWTVIAVKGHLWWKKCLLEDTFGKREKDYVLEEPAAKLYKYAAQSPKQEEKDNE